MYQKAINTRLPCKTQDFDSRAIPRIFGSRAAAKQSCIRRLILVSLPKLFLHFSVSPDPLRVPIRSLVLWLLPEMYKTLAYQTISKHAMCGMYPSMLFSVICRTKSCPSITKWLRRGYQRACSGINWFSFRAEYTMQNLAVSCLLGQS